MTHPTIAAFWQVVEGLSEEQKRSLLKFVTSCSKPPLLGFKVRFLINIQIIQPLYFRILTLLSASKTQEMTWRDFPQLPPV